jgi:hypothetical protein
MPMAAEKVVLDDKIGTTCLAVKLLHRSNAVVKGGQASVVADLLQRSQNGLVCVLPAACVLLAGVNVITVHIDDVPTAWAARADKL